MPGPTPTMRAVLYGNSVITTFPRLLHVRCRRSLRTSPQEFWGGKSTPETLTMACHAASWLA